MNSIFQFYNSYKLPKFITVIQTKSRDPGVEIYRLGPEGYDDVGTAVSEICDFKELAIVTIKTICNELHV